MKQLNDAQVFHYSKIYGSLTCETRLNVAVNTEDLTCPSKTGRTLKGVLTDFIKGELKFLKF